MVEMSGLGMQLGGYKMGSPPGLVDFSSFLQSQTLSSKSCKDNSCFSFNVAHKTLLQRRRGK